MSKFISFPKIRQFKDCVHNVRSRARFRGLDADGKAVFDPDAELPTLKFRGTVKLHGTNAAVVLHPDGSLVVQSRKRVLTLESDNAGFAAFVHGRVEAFRHIFENQILPEVKETKDKAIALYGEWCGSNIQSGVGLSKLPSKRFVIFAVRLHSEDGSEWLDMNEFDVMPTHPDFGIYNILEFPYWEQTVDFNSPAESRNEMVNITLDVEKECPVARAFGVDNGVGEGVVWRCIEPGFKSSDFWFKVKGEKHSTSKVKTLASVDPEIAKSAKEFVDTTVTENRCIQGIQYLKEVGKELDKRNTGIFLKWVFEDIMNEESDSLTASSLCAKDVSKPISTKARQWYFDFLEKSET